MVGVVRSLIADPLGDGGGDAGQLLHLGVEGRGVVRTISEGRIRVSSVNSARSTIWPYRLRHIVQAGPQKFAVLRRVLQVVLRHGQHQGVDRRVHGLGRVGLGGDVAVDFLHREVGGGVCCSAEAALPSGRARMVRIVREARSFFTAGPSFLSGMDLVYHARLLFSCQSDYIEMKKWLQNDCIGGQNALNF